MARRQPRGEETQKLRVAHRLLSFRLEQKEAALFDRQYGGKDGLDPGIFERVKRLHLSGVETFESCEGGPGHAFPQPTVRFGGGDGAGLKALSICADYGFNVETLNREWTVKDGQIDEVCWTIVFRVQNYREWKKRWNR